MMSKLVYSLNQHRLLNDMIVSCLPLITDVLTAAGSGPVFIAAGVWLFPLALLFIFPPSKFLADGRPESYN